MRDIRNISFHRLIRMAHAPTCIFSASDLAECASKQFAKKVLSQACDNEDRFFISASQKTTVSGQWSEECPDEGVNRDRQNNNKQNAKTHKNHNAKTHKNHNAKTHKTQEKLRQTHISYSSPTSCGCHSCSPALRGPLSGIPLAMDAIPHCLWGSIPAKLVGASR